MRGLTGPIARRSRSEDRVFVSRITAAVLNTTEKPLEGLRTVVVKSEQEQPAIFVERFLRAYRLLDFIACRVLCDKKRAQIAIHNCWQTASRNPPRFEYEGAFRSWLVRVLIDEALASSAGAKERGMRRLAERSPPHATNPLCRKVVGG
jgi:hypothetical protein